MMHLILKYLTIPILLGCSAADPPFPAGEIGAVETDPSSAPELANIILPEGFHIEFYARDLDNARSIDLAPDGTLYVGTRNKGNVYALQDEDGDFTADKVVTLAKNLNMPNGVAFHEGALYVAEVNRILRFDNIASNLVSDAPYQVINDSYPTDTHHGWKYIAFGPDGKLYVPVGAPCNICESDEIYNTITRINVDGTGFEIVHKGVRNTVGFDWHPESGELWFSDNGRDWLGDNSPACELNRAISDGLHFGYPYCHQGDLADPEFGHKFPCSDFVAPAQNLGPHVAPLGIEFYTGSQFPEEYHGQIFIAEHGSWNRSTPIGYRITVVNIDEQGVAQNYRVFAEGWLQGRRPTGRPVDLELLPDGSMLVSDDHGDAIYRIRYDP